MNTHYIVRDMVFLSSVENTMDRIYEWLRNFRLNSNDNEIYAKRQKEIVEILAYIIKKSGLDILNLAVYKEGKKIRDKTCVILLSRLTSSMSEPAKKDGLGSKTEKEKIIKKGYNSNDFNLQYSLT